jgi:effector-binding domain-containing protein
VHEQPKIEYRAAQPYVAVAATISMEQLAGAIARGFAEVFGWLDTEAMTPAGPPFIRYLQVDMPVELSIELAVPIGSVPPVDDRVRRGLLPDGHYAVLLHVGPYDGLVGANAALQQWARDRGIDWAMNTDGAWGGRVERYLTDPAQEPDPSQWQTEVAYLVARP